MGELAHEYLFPNITTNQRWSQPESELFAIGVTAAATAGVIALTNPGALAAIGFKDIVLEAAIVQGLTDLGFQAAAPSLGLPLM